MLCLSLLGPQPLAWLWVGSQVHYLTGSVTAGIVDDPARLLASLMLTLALAKRVDHAWKLVRRAAGYQQERGALERIFATSVGVALVVFTIWFFMIQGPGPSSRPAPSRVGFLDYYRQFDDIDEAEMNLRAARAPRARRRRWPSSARPTSTCRARSGPTFPHSEIVNAAIARARGRVHGYPDRHATVVRRLLAERHGLSPDQIALGNGAAELLQSATLALLSEGDELVTPWPSYPLIR